MKKSSEVQNIERILLLGENESQNSSLASIQESLITDQDNETSSLSADFLDSDGPELVSEYDYDDRITPHVAKYLSVVRKKPVSKEEMTKFNNQLVNHLLKRAMFDKFFEECIEFCDGLLNFQYQNFTEFDILVIKGMAIDALAVQKKLIAYSYNTSEMHDITITEIGAAAAVEISSNNTTYESLSKSAELYRLMAKIDCVHNNNKIRCMQKMLSISFNNCKHPEPKHIQILTDIMISMQYEKYTPEDSLSYLMPFYRGVRKRLIKYISENYISYTNALNDNFMVRSIMNINRQLSHIFFEFDFIASRLTIKNCKGELFLTTAGKLRLYTLLDSEFSVRVEDKSYKKYTQHIFLNNRHVQVRLKENSTYVEMTIGFFRENPILTNYGMSSELMIEPLKQDKFLFQDRFNEVFKYAYGFIIPSYCIKKFKSNAVLPANVCAWNRSIVTKKSIQQEKIMDNAHIKIDTSQFSWHHDTSFTIFRCENDVTVELTERGQVTQQAYNDKYNKLVKLS